VPRSQHQKKNVFSSRLNRCRKSAMAMPSSAYLLIAAGEDVAILHNTRFSEVLRFTTLHCIAYFYFQL